MKDIVRHAILALILAPLSQAPARALTPEERPAPQDPAKAAKPANTPKTPTATDQGSSKEDVALTRRIRSALVAAPDLGVRARNVKVITRAGRVTLRGTVESAAEKDQVEAIAREAAGADRVTSRLQVRTARKDRNPAPPSGEAPPTH